LDLHQSHDHQIEFVHELLIAQSLIYQLDSPSISEIFTTDINLHIQIQLSMKAIVLQQGDFGSTVIARCICISTFLISVACWMRGPWSQ